MLVAMRADASPTIGSGHVMRCLTLAEGLKRRGIEVCFICREGEGSLNSFVEAKGFALHGLPDNLEGQQQDALLTRNIISGWDKKPDVLIVDHYKLDQQWESQLRPLAGKIMVIDDTADRHHDCDILLDQNLVANMEARYKDLVPSSCTQLLGPKYALLRDEFKNLRNNPPPKSDGFQILVNFGGGGNVPAWEVSIEALREVKNDLPEDTKIIAVFGNMEVQARDRLEKNLKQSGLNYEAHSFVSNLAELMAASHMAIGAGGSTTWERCCLGVPSVVLTIADNQVELTEECHKIGAIIYAGHIGQISEENVATAIQECVQNKDAIAQKAKDIIDGQGAERVAQKVLEQAGKLRFVEESDSASLLKWRNKDHVRLASLNQQPIPEEGHKKWFSGLPKGKATDDRAFFIFELAGQPVGTINFKRTGDKTWEWGFHIGEENAPRGAGHAMCKQGLEFAFDKLGAEKVNATVLNNNPKSTKLHHHMGFEELKKEGEQTYCSVTKERFKDEQH